jgi:hypothetical protein
MKLLNLLVSVSFVFLIASSSVLASSLTEAQKSYIDRVLVERGLNIYGDPKDTVYAGGNPLFDEVSGVMLDRHEYVVRKLPDILNGFVGILPVDAVDRVVKTSRQLASDLDARRPTDRTLAAFAANAAAVDQLVESIRAAVEKHDLVAIRDLLIKVSLLPSEQLPAFSSVLVETRRMLQMPTIQPIEVTSQVAELLGLLDAIQARIR